MEKKDFLNKAKREVSLENHTTMRTGCVARFLFEAETEEDLLGALKVARQLGLPFLILGKGSNTILPSRYEGVVVLMKMDGLEIMEKKNNLYAFAQAGVFLPRLAREVVKKEGRGIEWAAGVPGTVGGAVYNNSGAFGSFMDSCLKEVVALNINSMEKERLENKECGFGYRDSIFKKRKDLVVLRAEMEFSRKEGGEEKMKELLQYRRDHHPAGFSAGSFFKNPRAKKEVFEKYPELDGFKEQGFIPAAYLIEKCGLKGKKIGGAQVSAKHANFIINRGNAGREDIGELVTVIKRKVKEDFGIELEEEVELIE